MDKINEKKVAGLWMSHRLTDFIDDLGNFIEVICPGRVSAGQGCDFQDAVIRVNGQKVVGDIEVHVTSDLWIKHGHNKDAASNGVILHVAMWQKGGLPVRLQDGRVLPTVVLSQYMINVSGGMLRRWETGGIRTCIHGNGHGKAIGKVLMIEGLGRFEEKAARFSDLLRNAEAEQVLYKGICRALGYGRNKEPFEALADRLPLSVISDRAADNLLHKQALLLGAAGLLPSHGRVMEDQFPDDYIGELENWWSRLLGGMVPGKASDWSLTLVRPVNHPVRRIAALSYLLHRYQTSGLLQGLKYLAGSARSGAAKGLTDGLQVNGDYYWVGHLAFGRPNRATSALIGKGRAGEIAVNVILPFFIALARKNKDTRLENVVLNNYLQHPSLPANELTRYMSRLLFGRHRGKLNGCLQQGLIRLFHRYCRVKDCECCPVFISRKQARA